MSVLVRSERDKAIDEWINGGFDQTGEDGDKDRGRRKLGRPPQPWPVTFTCLEISIIVTNVMKRIKVVN